MVLEGDLGWIKWVMGGMGAVGLALIGLVRAECAQGRAKLWERVNEKADKAGDDRVEDARLYATRGDLDSLREHVDRKFGELGREVRQAIINRPAVGSGE